MSGSASVSGSIIWTISPAERGTRAALEWNVEVRKGLVRHLTPVLRPLFAWNHNWVMGQGESALKRRLGV